MNKSKLYDYLKIKRPGIKYKWTYWSYLKTDLTFIL